jgi:hypothetical protein
MPTRNQNSTMYKMDEAQKEKSRKLIDELREKERKQEKRDKFIGRMLKSLFRWHF